MPLNARWESATLGELCLPIDKKGPSETGRKTIKYIDIGSVDGDRQKLSNVPEIDANGAPSRCRQLVHAGDTVFATVRPYLKKIAYVDESLADEFASTGFAVLRPGPRLDSRFLFYFAICQDMLDQVLPFQKGVSYPAVLDKEVRRAVMPVPPLKEQQRIVDILEDHLSRLDAAATDLGSARRRLRSLTAALLAKETRDFEEVPLASLATHSGYGTSTRCVPAGLGPAVVRIPNLVSGHIDMSDEKRVADARVDVTGLLLSEGDLLIVRTNGSRDLIGRSAVVQSGVEAAFASYLIRFRLDSSRVLPEWVHAVLSSPSARNRLEARAASSAGQYNLSLGKLGPIPIPVPEMEDQRRILAVLTDHLAATKRMQQDIVRALDRATRLRQALLNAAFSGRLTSRTSGEALEEMAAVQ